MTREFRAEQRIVAAGMAGALVTAIVVVAAVVLRDSGMPSPFSDRLRSALRADLFVVAWLAAAIANVARLRFFSERDIAGSNVETASTAVRQASAILQNTFEQVVLAVIAHLILTATFAHSGAVVEALICLFAAGRLLFWVGYRHGAAGRAFGFALTFYPSIGALVAAAIAIALGRSV